MILSDVNLRKALADGRLVVAPCPEAAIRPASIDLRLSSMIRVFDHSVYSHVDITEEMPAFTSVVNMDDVGNGIFMLQPGEFILGSTMERVRIGIDLAAKVEGRSSIGRLGLMVHCTAGYIDPGFSGSITLELYNHMRIPIGLRTGMSIGQLVVFQLAEPSERPYGSPDTDAKYQGQHGPTPSMLWREYRERS